MHLIVLNLLLGLVLVGCAAVPGMTARGLEEKSVVQLAPATGDSLSPEQVVVQRITAEFIVEKERPRILCFWRTASRSIRAT